MTETTPLEKLSHLHECYALGGQATPTELAQVILALHNSDLGDCENALALLASVMTGDSYTTAVWRTTLGPTGFYED